ncbi:NAD(P)/FAD-dependent oxidoreductase [Pseudonocardia sp. TRM90224]|uniref:NAD(P)/FAD-dependent oxidoreductase n=1 Tax=Pseudonocardia sp. TRM90224 TaxID=2812678 RepID=UPI001E5FFD83|nr:FAD-binding oxidoreductase [Pseudonocardia sp. TRM90224]
MITGTTTSRSYWQAALPEFEPGPTPGPSSRPLPFPERVDVAVIGAGFAGLSIACDLLESAPGIEVAVLDAHGPGFGASGRNAGGVLPFAVPQWLLPGRVGPLTGTEAIVVLRGLIADRMRRLAADHPTAEVRPTTMLLMAAHPPVHTGLRWTVGRMAAAGLESEWWDRDRVAATGTLRRPALTFPAWTVQPAALAAALAGTPGLQMLGNHPVAAVEPTHGGVEIVLRSGATLNADRAVVATGAYTSDLRLPDRIDGAVVHASMQADPPGVRGTDDLFAAAVGVRPTYWRVHEGRLLFGGADRSRPTPEAGRAVQRLRDRYRPGAAGATPDFRWNGPILVRRGELPLLAHSPACARITYAVGFAGSGVALATSAGPLVRDLVLGPAAADPVGATLRAALAATPTVPTAALRALRPRR